MHLQFSFWLPTCALRKLLAHAWHCFWMSYSCTNLQASFDNVNWSFFMLDKGISLLLKLFFRFSAIIFSIWSCSWCSQIGAAELISQRDWCSGTEFLVVLLSGELLFLSYYLYSCSSSFKYWNLMLEWAPLPWLMIKSRYISYQKISLEWIIQLVTSLWISVLIISKC